MSHPFESAEAHRAMEAVAQAIKETPVAGQRDQLCMLATIAICMIHGTYGAQFTRDYLAGALAELDLPKPMKIKLETRDAPQSH